MIGYLPPVEQCRVVDTRITEASGLAASDLDPGVLFTHNDSGDGARFFALGPDCRTRGVFRLRGAQARDWEDVARGPGHVLWLGDIGDNRSSRTSISVYRVPEPRADASGDVTWTRYRFTYPDGPHDAETLLADPRDGRLYVVTKALLGAATVYAAPLPVRDGALTAVATVPLALVTGGDISPDGSRLVLRTYGRAYETRLPAAGLAFPDGVGAPVALPPEDQGEAVAYSADGRSLLTTSEGRHAPVHVLRSEPSRPVAREVRTARPWWPWAAGAAALVALLAVRWSRARRP